MGAAATQEKPSEFYQLPDPKALEAAGDFDITDENGNKIAFKSLFTGKPEGERQLIIFIRHFFCGFCEDYVAALARDLPPAQLAAANTTLTIIGCGEHTHIADYKKRTGSPFEIYCDPQRRLYDKLGMVVKLGGSTKPGYLSGSMFSIIARSARVGMSYGWKGRNAGKISQNGGEYLFQNGALTWCHRMKDTADHAETSELKQVLNL